MGHAVELIGDFQSRGLLGGGADAELRRLAAALDETTEPPTHEVALCHFFARLAEVIARDRRRNTELWSVLPN